VPDPIDSEGFLADIDVQSVKASGSSREDKSRDIEEFFGAPVDRMGANGSSKKHRMCKLCPYYLLNLTSSLRADLVYQRRESNARE
jgi:hypothetical protein